MLWFEIRITFFFGKRGSVRDATVAPYAKATSFVAYFVRLAVERIGRRLRAHRGLICITSVCLKHVFCSRRD